MVCCIHCQGCHDTFDSDQPVSSIANNVVFPSASSSSSVEHGWMSDRNPLTSLVDGSGLEEQHQGIPFNVLPSSVATKW